VHVIGFRERVFSLSVGTPAFSWNGRALLQRVSVLTIVRRRWGCFSPFPPSSASPRQSEPLSRMFFPAPRIVCNLFFGRLLSAIEINECDLNLHRTGFFSKTFVILLSDYLFLPANHKKIAVASLASELLIIMLCHF